MAANPKHLVVLIGGQEIGDLEQTRHGQLAFTYRDVWRQQPSATPLSLSMPLARPEHRQKTVDPFLRGLLPDNDEVLNRWGKRYGVSPNSPFAILAHVGDDDGRTSRF